MDDAQIIDGVRRGDAAACEALVKQYGPRLLRAANGLCRCAVEAEDLVQDTLVAAIRQARTFRGRSALFTWLYGILRYKHLGRRRKQRRSVTMVEVPETDASAPTHGSASDRRVVGQALAVALQHLSDEHRQVVLMRYADEMKIGAIAAALGLPTGTVKSRLHYALRILRKELGEGLNLFR